MTQTHIKRHKKHKMVRENDTARERLRSKERKRKTSNV
jgi:hypothetical protein